MSDEEIIEELTKIKDRQWTAEMFSMFTMAREDVFSYGDVGLKCNSKLYKKSKTHKKQWKVQQKMEALNLRCSHPWRSLDNDFKRIPRNIIFTNISPCLFQC
jgi:3-methyladenine DNA glycosylase/8-oxoguanine DNA glycosylase